MTTHTKCFLRDFASLELLRAVVLCANEIVLGHNTFPHNERIYPTAMQRHADYQAALGELPSAQMYEKSFMHRDVVTHVAVGAHDFILTGSADGDLRFWKKTPVRSPRARCA